MGTPTFHNTAEQPHSALNLRLLLVLFGIAVSTGLAIGAALAGAAGLMWLGIVLVLVGLIDLIVVLRRRRTRQRESPGNYSLFE